MKKVVLFPFNIHCSEILRYNHFSSKYEIVGAIAPKGWGIGGRDIGFIDGGRDTGIYIQDTINYAKDFDGVLVVSECAKPELENIIIEFVCDILAHGKEVYFTSQITNVLEKICEKYPKQVHLNKEDDFIEIKTEKMYDINTPVIMVAGMHELTHKFKIQLEIRQYFQELGYSVSHISSKKIGAVLGAHSFPQFMFDEIAENKKIYTFNHFVRMLEKEEQPDVIIIGVPGEVMPYSKKFPSHFGITLYEVMQAVQPDAFILSCLYDKYDDIYFRRLVTSLKYKYGVDVDGINISTFQVDYNETEQNNSLQYFRVTHNEIDYVINNYTGTIPLYNVMNGDDGKKMAELVYNKLVDLGAAEKL